MSYIQHVILHSDTVALDGLDDVPLNSVTVVGVTGDDVSAIDAVVAHFERTNAEGAVAKEFADKSSMLVPNPEFDARRDASNQLWFLRGAGDGNEIHAGFGRTTLYRIVPVAA